VNALFAHANGYPPGSYEALLSGLGAHVDVQAIEHRPLWAEDPAPTFLSWQVYARDLLDRIKERDDPVWVVGHSMGAASAILAASQEPSRFKGIVALDPVLISDRFWFWSRLMTRLKPDVMPIVKRALARPHQFESYEAAFQFYRGKRVFQQVSDEVLMDYVKAGHQEAEDEQVCLRYSGSWEACVYRSVPYIFHRLKRLSLPMLGLVGEDTDVLEAAALDRWQTVVPQLQLRTLSGGHLLPLENPEDCLEQIHPFLKSL